MRFLAIMTAGAIVIGAGISVNAAPLSGTTMSGAGNTSVQLVQMKKDETVTQKVKRSVKRAYKRLTGYKFEVSCLTSHTTCTETGKDREVARGKCQSAHPLCVVKDAN
jgi:hypothetical protein